MEYIELDWSEVDYPVDEELYELVNGEYVLSTDEDSVEGKTYYLLDDEEEDDDYEPEYVERPVSAGDNPSELDLYELVDDEYVSTEDEVVVSGKTYYELVETIETDEAAEELDLESDFYPVDDDDVYSPVEQNLYEFIDGGYSLSEDVEPISGKTYYEEAEPEEFEEIDEEDEDAYDTYIPDGEAEDLERDNIAEESVIDVRAENFIYAYLGFVTNPQEEGLWELVDGLYQRTNDVEIVPNKTYYEYYEHSDMYIADVSGIDDFTSASGVYYEKTESGYDPTIDQAPMPGKTYYKSHTEDLNPYVADPSVNAEDATMDDLPDASEQESSEEG